MLHANMKMLNLHQTDNHSFRHRRIWSPRVDSAGYFWVMEVEKRLVFHLVQIFDRLCGAGKFYKRF